MHTVIETENLVFRNTIGYPDLIIGEHVVFIKGPSGCGKTTFFKILNHTVSDYTGSVRFRGLDISEIDPLELRKDLLYVGQSVFLFKGTILDNFREFYDYSERDAPSEDEIKKILKICCIDKDLNSQCDTMSGGERQRVFNAIYLSMKPKVLMLDEPTSALDYDLSIKFMESVIKYCKNLNISLLIISHDPELTREFSETVIDFGDVQ